MKLKWLGHASFKLTNGNIIYVDPYNINDSEKADIILISHGHYDHYSIEDIKRISKDDTDIVTTKDAPKKLSVTSMKAKDKLHLKNIKIEAVPAYNINKFRAPNELFHPKGSGIGFILDINKKRIYFAGDTDFIPEMKKIKADIAILPIGGIYTMTVEEAVEAVNTINPKTAIPMHYDSIVGSKADADDFKRKVGSKAVVLEKGEEFEF